MQAGRKLTSVYADSGDVDDFGQVVINEDPDGNTEDSCAGELRRR